MASHARDAALADSDPAAIDAGLARAEAPFTRPTGDLHCLRERLGHLMWEKVGILRDADGLSRALDALDDMRAELAQTGLADSDRAFNLTWHDWLNLDSLIDASEVIARAALARQDSRGAHFREDFPETGDLAATAYTRVRRGNDGMALEFVPVDFDIVRPGESLIDGEARAPTAAE